MSENQRRYRAILSAIQRASRRRSRKLGGARSHYVTSREPRDRARDIAIDVTLRAVAKLYERRLSEANPALICSVDAGESRAIVDGGIGGALPILWHLS